MVTLLLALVPSAYALTEPVDIRFRNRGIGAVLSSHGTQTSGPYSFEPEPSDPVAEPFDTVGVNGVLPDMDVDLEVCREERDGTWSAWVPLVVRGYEGGRFWATAAFPTSAPGRVRVRVRGPALPRERRLSLYGLEAFEDPRRQGQGRIAEEAAWGMGAPPMITRKEWGARAAKDTEPMDAYRMTIHHTEGSYVESVEAGKRETKAIQEYHMDGRGWDDIGYHFLMDAGGNIYQGRPANVLGTHTANNNAGNIGISLMGNYDEVSPTRAQMDSLKALLKHLSKTYGVSSKNLYGHRELSDSSCPGDNLFAKVPELRKAVAGSSVIEREEWDAILGRISAPLGFDGSYWRSR